MWNDEYYEQTDGAAMGNPLSPIVVNIYMEFFEEMALQSAMVKPKMWLRYVDDTFVIWSGDKEELSMFQQHLNSLRPSIQFTMEGESDGQLPFLDVLVKKEDGRLITSLHPLHLRPSPQDKGWSYTIFDEEGTENLYEW